MVASPAPDARGLEILRLMSVGMKDDVIARVLGVSRRTVQQEISDLGSLLGARTRFQIALFAQQRGWLPLSQGADPAATSVPASPPAGRPSSPAAHPEIRVEPGADRDTMRSRPAARGAAG